MIYRFNLLTDFPKEVVMQFVCIYFQRLFTDIFSKNVQILMFFFLVGKISALWWSRFKNYLNPHVVNLSVCVFNILFGCKLRKNKTIARKFWYVFELHRVCFTYEKLLWYRTEIFFTGHFIFLNNLNRHEILIRF